jgi:hypothetical protein
MADWLLLAVIFWKNAQKTAGTSIQSKRYFLFKPVKKWIIIIKSQLPGRFSKALPLSIVAERIYRLVIYWERTYQPGMQQRKFSMQITQRNLKLFIKGIIKKRQYAKLMRSTRKSTILANLSTVYCQLNYVSPACHLHKKAARWQYRA